MSTATLISASDYLNTAYDGPDREYIDGVVMERSMPITSHSHVQAQIGAFIIANYPGFWAGTELRMRVSPTRYRVADVAVVRGGMPEEAVPTSAPELVVEIVSPDDRAGDLNDKIRDYRAWGVPYVWVIFPGSRHALIYTRDGIQEVTSTLQAGDISVPLSAILPA